MSSAGAKALAEEAFLAEFLLAVIEHTCKQTSLCGKGRFIVFKVLE